MKRFLIVVVLLLLVLVSALLFNTMLFESKQLAVETIPSAPPTASAIEHFQKSISFKTISHGDSMHFDSSAFFDFHRYLQSAYPLVHATMKRERVARYSLLYEWEGKNAALSPVI